MMYPITPVPSLLFQNLQNLKVALLMPDFVNWLQLSIDALGG